MAIHRICMRRRGLHPGLKMSDDLMAEEVEIDPLVRASPFVASKQRTIEGSRGSKIVDREGDVKRCERHAKKSP